MVAQDLLKGLDAAAQEVDVGLGSRLTAIFPSCVLTRLATADASGAFWAGTIALIDQKKSCQRVVLYKTNLRSECFEVCPG